MNITETLSSQRLSAYRLSAGDDTAALLGRYGYNLMLSEALYPALHSAEVALRNHVHTVIGKSLNEPNWLLNCAILDKREAGILKVNIENLIKQSKPVDEGKLIAELNFGFWTSLFDVRYERIVWQKAIKDVFPQMPRRLRTRHNILARLNRIRNVRNRVFHYEPIWHWNNLSKLHQEILETIHWISPEMKEFVFKIDRFDEVYQTSQTARF